MSDYTPDANASQPGAHAPAASGHASTHPQLALPSHAGDVPGQKKSNGSLWRKAVLGLVVLLAIVFTIYKIRSNKKELADTANKANAAANRPIPVTVTPVRSRTMPIYLTALGTVTAYNTVTVKSRVDGQLLSVPVREGQQVRQGQTLATIDPRPYQAIVDQATGTLQKDEAAAANAKAEAARYTALYQAGVISKESQQLQVSTAGQANGTISQDRATIEAAKVNVAYTRITSPINGVVGLRQVDAGNIVHASDANGLLVVTQLQPIAVIFTLPEDQLPQVLQNVRAGKKLVVEAFDRSQTTHLATGTLLTVDNQIDTTTGMVKIKAIFDNKDNTLFPNQFVNVRLVLEQRANSLVVPASAIQTGNAGTFVYVVHPGHAPASMRQKNGEAGSGKGKGGDNTAGGGAAAGASDDTAANNEEASQSGNSGKAGGQHQPKQDPYYVERATVVVDITEGSNVILRSGVKPGDLLVIDGQEKLTQGKSVAPKQGTSSAGGPDTMQIGAPPGSTGEPQPGSPAQGKPEAGARTTGPKQPSGNTNGQSNGNGGGRP